MHSQGTWPRGKTPTCSMPSCQWTLLRVMANSRSRCSGSPYWCPGSPVPAVPVCRGQVARGRLPAVCPGVLPAREAATHAGATVLAVVSFSTSGHPTPFNLIMHGTILSVPPQSASTVVEPRAVCLPSHVFVRQKGLRLSCSRTFWMPFSASAPRTRPTSCCGTSWSSFASLLHVPNIYTVHLSSRS